MRNHRLRQQSTHIRHTSLRKFGLGRHAVSLASAPRRSELKSWTIAGLICLLLGVSEVAADETPDRVEQRPNILFCIADDWGWPHAGAYGAGDWVKTPTFDRLAKEGVLFENAFTSNPKCCPSRASMVAGRNTWQMKEAVNHIVPWPSEFVSYVDLLEQAGYHVGMTGKGWGPGTWKDSGRTTNPAGPSYDQFKLDPPYRGISNNDYARNFTEGFLAARPSDETPFCFWLGAKEPHRGYEEGAGLRTGKDPRSVDLPAFYPEEKVIREDMLDYAIEVEWFDSHVGRCLDYLEQIGELDNTIVVMTSDHGMPFPRVKGQIYEHAFHLPLAIRWGDVSGGGRSVKDFVNVRDFAPTFLEAAGVKPHAQFTGSSLVSLLKSNRSGWIEPETRNVMLVGKERHDLGRPNDWGYPVRAIRTADYLYVHNYEPDRWPAGNPETVYRNCDGGPTKSKLLNSFDKWYAFSFGKRPEHELYRISVDTDCVHNLIDQPGYETITRQLRERMEVMLREEGDLRALGTPEWFDAIPYTASRKHAYETWLNYQRVQPEVKP